MPLVCICSPKGGVGKTTFAANLAHSLARSGSKVLVIDFDVQNALRLHFGVPLSDERGYVTESNHASDWSQFILKAGTNTFVLPYGDVDEAKRLAFEHELISDPHFLQRGLHSVLNYPGLVVIADFPPGPSPALKAMQGIADMHLIVMLADTASLSLLPQVEKGKLIGVPLDNKVGTYFVVNQSDNRRQISHDVSQFFEQRLGDQLLGMIHRDECVPEANASQRSIIDFSPVSAAAFDIELISKKVASILGIKIGGGEVYSTLQHDLYN